MRRRHSKSHPRPFAGRGEFNGIIPEPLPVYSESFMAIAITV